MRQLTERSCINMTGLMSTQIVVLLCSHVTQQSITDGPFPVMDK